MHVASLSASAVRPNFTSLTGAPGRASLSEITTRGVENEVELPRLRAGISRLGERWLVTSESCLVDLLVHDRQLEEANLLNGHEILAVLSKDRCAHRSRGERNKDIANQGVGLSKVVVP